MFFKINIFDYLIEFIVLLDEVNIIWKCVKFVYDVFCLELKVIWVILGGGWGVSIFGELMSYLKLDKIKLIIGYFDIMVLYIYVNEYLNFFLIYFVVLGINGDIFLGYNKNGLGVILDIFSGKKIDVIYELLLFNKFVVLMIEVIGKIVGGNFFLVFVFNGVLGFLFKIKGKFLFLEFIVDDFG